MPNGRVDARATDKAVSPNNLTREKLVPYRAAAPNNNQRALTTSDMGSFSVVLVLVDNDNGSGWCGGVCSRLVVVMSSSRIKKEGSTRSSCDCGNSKLYVVAFAWYCRRVVERRCCGCGCCRQVVIVEDRPKTAGEGVEKASLLDDAKASSSTQVARPTRKDRLVVVMLLWKGMWSIECIIVCVCVLIRS